MPVYVEAGTEPGSDQQASGQTNVGLTPPEAKFSQLLSDLRRLGSPAVTSLIFRAVEIGYALGLQVAEEVAQSMAMEDHARSNREELGGRDNWMNHYRQTAAVAWRVAWQIEHQPRVILQPLGEPDQGDSPKESV